MNSISFLWVEKDFPQNTTRKIRISTGYKNLRQKCSENDVNFSKKVFTCTDKISCKISQDDLILLHCNHRKIYRGPCIIQMLSDHPHVIFLQTMRVDIGHVSIMCLLIKFCIIHFKSNITGF